MILVTCCLDFNTNIFFNICNNRIVKQMIWERIKAGHSLTGLLHGD